MNGGNPLNIIVTLDSSSVDQKLSRITGNIRNMARHTRTTNAQLDQLNKTMNKLVSSINKTNNQLKTQSSQLIRTRRYWRGFHGTLFTTTVALGLLENALAAVGFTLFGWQQYILVNTSRLERMKMMMVQLSTEADATADAMKQVNYILELSRNVPFNLDSVKDSFLKLKTVGIDPTLGSLEATINAVSAMGGNSENLKRATVAIQQSKSKIALSLEEIKGQLAEAIPSAISDMAIGMGVTIPRLLKQIETGTVDATYALNRMFLQWDLAYAGASNRLMETYEGQIERFMSLFENLTTKVGDMDNQTGYYREVIRSLKDLNEYLASPQAAGRAKQLGDILGELALKTRQFIDLIVENQNEVMALLKVIGALVATRIGIAIVRLLIKPFTTLFGVFKGAKTVFSNVANGLRNLGKSQNTRGLVYIYRYLRLVALIGTRSLSRLASTLGFLKTSLLGVSVGIAGYLGFEGLSLAIDKTKEKLEEYLILSSNAPKLVFENPQMIDKNKLKDINETLQLTRKELESLNLLYQGEGSDKLTIIDRIAAGLQMEGKSVTTENIKEYIKKNFTDIGYEIGINGEKLEKEIAVVLGQLLNFDRYFSVDEQISQFSEKLASMPEILKKRGYAILAKEKGLPFLLSFEAEETYKNQLDEFSKQAEKSQRQFTLNAKAIHKEMTELEYIKPFRVEYEKEMARLSQLLKKEFEFGIDNMQKHLELKQNNWLSVYRNSLIAAYDAGTDPTNLHQLNLEMQKQFADELKKIENYRRILESGTMGEIRRVVNSDTDIADINQEVERILSTFDKKTESQYQSLINPSERKLEQFLAAMRTRLNVEQSQWKFLLNAEQYAQVEKTIASLIRLDEALDLKASNEELRSVFGDFDRFVSDMHIAGGRYERFVVRVKKSQKTYEEAVASNANRSVENVGRVTDAELARLKGNIDYLNAVRESLEQNLIDESVTNEINKLAPDLNRVAGQAERQLAPVENYIKTMSDYSEQLDRLDESIQINTLHPPVETPPKDHLKLMTKLVEARNQLVEQMPLVQEKAAAQAIDQLIREDFADVSRYLEQLNDEQNRFEGLTTKERIEQLRLRSMELKKHLNSSLSHIRHSAGQESAIHKAKAKKIQEIDVALEAERKKLVKTNLSELGENQQDSFELLSNSVAMSFQSIGDAIEQMVRDGRVDLDNLFKSLAAQIARLVIMETVVKRIAKHMSDAFEKTFNLESLNDEKTVSVKIKTNGGDFDAPEAIAAPQTISTYQEREYTKIVPFEPPVSHLADWESRYKAIHIPMIETPQNLVKPASTETFIKPKPEELQQSSKQYLLKSLYPHLNWLGNSKPTETSKPSSGLPIAPQTPSVNPVFDFKRLIDGIFNPNERIKETPPNPSLDREKSNIDKEIQQKSFNLNYIFGSLMDSKKDDTNIKINVINQSDTPMTGHVVSSRFDSTKQFILDVVLEAMNTPSNFRNSMKRS